MSWTVKQLRQALANLVEVPEDTVVLTEGCDCWGDIGSLEKETGVALEPNGQSHTVVLLKRSGEGMYG